jgi:hypothetical protein
MLTVRTLDLKHAAPDFRSGASAHDWTLSDEGRTQARALAERLRDSKLGAVVTSAEPKAFETGAFVETAWILRLPRAVGPATLARRVGNGESLRPFNLRHRPTFGL